METNFDLQASKEKAVNEEFIVSIQIPFITQYPKRLFAKAGMTLKRYAPHWRSNWMINQIQDFPWMIVEAFQLQTHGKKRLFSPAD